MSTQAIGANTLGQDVFLKLLVTQLQFQDPLKPLESTEFVSQLAQFTELEQMTALKTNVDGMVRLMASLNNYGAVDLIGKEVQVAGVSVAHTAGTPSTLNYSLDAPASAGAVSILNVLGEVVRALEVGPQYAGPNSALWDGLDSNGDPVPSGSYTFSVQALDASGAPVRGATYTQGQVSGVTYENGVPYLIVNGERVLASSVAQISNRL
jgi:flagellar basal-body rod modification protein FlgD